MSISINTPTKRSKFSMEIDPDKETIIITSEKDFSFKYKLRSLRDLYLWLKNDHGGEWVLLGSRGEEDTPKNGSVEEWARDVSNPVGGFYGLTDRYKGRFASFIPAILEHFGFVEFEDKKRNIRVRSL